MKPAEKPRGWLGHSGDSSHTGSPASRMLLPPASGTTCAAQGKHLHLAQTHILTQRLSLESALAHAKAQQSTRVSGPQLPAFACWNSAFKLGHTAGTSLWLSSTHLPGKAWSKGQDIQQAGSANKSGSYLEADGIVTGNKPEGIGQGMWAGVPCPQIVGSCPQHTTELACPQIFMGEGRECLMEWTGSAAAAGS